MISPPITVPMGKFEPEGAEHDQPPRPQFTSGAAPTPTFTTASRTRNMAPTVGTGG